MIDRQPPLYGRDHTNTIDDREERKSETKHALQTTTRDMNNNIPFTVPTPRNTPTTVIQYDTLPGKWRK